MKIIQITYLSVCYALFIMLLWPSDAHAQQSKSYLEKKKERLEKSIEYADLLIDDARKRKNSTLQDLALLQSKIDNRRMLISNYLSTRNQLFDTIFDNMLQINDISIRLHELKEEYALMVNSAYANHNIYKRMVYVLAAEDINQAYSRFNYYKYYAKNRNSQIEYIRKVETSYFKKVDQLEQKVEQNQQLLSQLEQEYVRLESEISQKNQLVKELTNEVKQLARDQHKKMISSRNLEKKIEEIILEEGMAVKSMPVNEQLFNTPTPEEKILSAGFNENFGKLPWPLERGIISAHFGEQSHPEIQEVKIKNNGLDFLTHEGAAARAIFDGVVTRVLCVPNFDHVVILRHGDFLSVYSNLSEVFVKQGMMIGTKEEIGSVHTNKQENKTELHFEIWNGKELQNPADWIATPHENQTQLHIQQ
jgi:murein hydrolase activator